MECGKVYRKCGFIDKWTKIGRKYVQYATNNLRYRSKTNFYTEVRNMKIFKMAAKK